MAPNKPRPSQAGQLHRIAALGYHADGKAISSSRGIRKVKDSQGNSISAPRNRNWNGATNDLLISITSGKGKERAVEADDDEGPGPSSPRRSLRERVGVSTRVTRSASKKKKRQFMDCVLLPSRPRSRHGTAGQPQGTPSSHFSVQVANLHLVGSPEPPPLPDSDFLKLIHYSASTFYESRGQLRDRAELLSEVRSAGDDLREAKRKHGKGKAPKPARQRAERAAKMKTMHTAFGGDVLLALGMVILTPVRRYPAHLNFRYFVGRRHNSATQTDRIARRMGHNGSRRR